MRSFPTTLTAFAGESLLSFLARTGLANGRPSIAQVLQVAALEADFILSAPYRVEPVLSELLNISADDLALMSYSADSKSRKTSELGTLHLQPVRRKHISTQVRRISPTSLSRGLYHRALWDLKVLPVCTESGELLISTCPGCGKPLKWKSTELALCGQPDCRFDLREVPSTFIQDEHLHQIRFLSELMSPHAARREEARRSIHEGLHALTNSELLDFVILCGLADRHASDDGWKQAHSEIASGNFTKWSPDQLAGGLAVLMGWPGEFYKLLKRLDDHSGHRRGNFGLRKHFGILAELVDRSKHDRKFVRVFELAINKFVYAYPHINIGPTAGHRVSVKHRTLTLGEAADKLGMSRKRFKKVAGEFNLMTTKHKSGSGIPVRIDKKKFEKLESAYTGLVSPSQVHFEFGIGAKTLSALVSSSLIERASGPERLLRPNNYVSRNNVRSFLKKIEQRASLKAGVPLARVIENPSDWLPRYDPWFALLDGLARGVVPLGINEAQKKIGLRFIVDPALARNYIRYRCERSTQLTLTEASAILGCRTDVIRELFDVLHISLDWSAGSHAHWVDAAKFYSATYTLIPAWRMMEMLSCGDHRKLLEEARAWRLAPRITLKKRGAVFFDVRDFRDPDQLSLLEPRRQPWAGPLFGTGPVPEPEIGRSQIV